MNKKILDRFGFVVSDGHCPACDGKIDLSSFRDAISKREFEISGLCQKCQDKIFGVKK